MSAEIRLRNLWAARPRSLRCVACPVYQTIFKDVLTGRIDDPNASRKTPGLARRSDESHYTYTCTNPPVMVVDGIIERLRISRGILFSTIENCVYRLTRAPRKPR